MSKELKNICIDRSLAIRLKELGAKQDSLFYWHEYPSEWDIAIDGCGYCPDKDKDYSAFTAEEILERLPRKIEVGDEIYFLSISVEDDGYYVSYNYEVTYKGEIKVENKLSNALALMWIYLLENKLAEVNDE